VIPSRDEFEKSEIQSSQLRTSVAQVVDMVAQVSAPDTFEEFAILVFGLSVLIIILIFQLN
jgi:hypothetical protein